MAADEPKTQPSREGKVALTIHVDPELRYAVKELAVKQRTTVQEMLESHIRKLITSKPKSKPKS